MKYIHSAVLFSLGLVSLSAPVTACELTRSVYRAVGNPDFQLIFAKPPTNLAAVVRATVTLQHPKRGTILSLYLNQSQGYGAFVLSDPKTDEANYPLYFFNEKLESTSVGKEAPAYTFVATLGVSDYYSNRSGNRQNILGDVMWKLDACRK